MKFLTMPVNTAIWRYYDVKSVGNDEYIGGVIISEKTRPPKLNLHDKLKVLRNNFNNDVDASNCQIHGFLWSSRKLRAIGPDETRLTERKFYHT